ncbi:MAG: GtrA family protein [Kiritimatiellia bacterium]|nr:GtrA family protein [Kiritimatiellia bacterium]
MDSIKSILAQFTQRKASLPIQFLKYSISGCIAVAVHIVAFYLFSWLLVPALKEDDIVVRILHLTVAAINDTVRARNAVINNWLAFIFSNFAAYILNVWWVFESGRHKRWVEITMFYAVSAISIAVGSAIMGLMIKYMGSSTTLAFAADIVAAVMVNFVVRKYYIFKG